MEVMTAMAVGWWPVGGNDGDVNLNMNKKQQKLKGVMMVIVEWKCAEEKRKEKKDERPSAASCCEWWNKWKIV